MTRCPECRAAMVPRDLDGLPARACATCGGLWFAREFVDLWAQRVRGRAGPLRWKERAAGPSTATCPDCATPMRVVEAKELSIDHCPRCEGLYFDPGELAALGRALSSERRPPSATGPTPVGASEATTDATTLDAAATDPRLARDRRSPTPDAANRGALEQCGLLAIDLLGWLVDFD